MSALEGSVVAINDPKWPNALLVDEGNLGGIINSINSHKEANNSDWGYEYVKNHCKAVIAKDGDGSNSNLQMMSYNDLLLTENDDRNKAYSCCLECSLGFIDYSKQPDSNFKHVLVYQDDLTKFTILKPIKEKGRDEISRCLLEIFSLIGVPGKINTRERSLVKSVFNRDVGTFFQNFSTKIKQSKNGPFEEKELRKIDTDIKEWMKSAMSAKWSQGLCFVQFQNNCYVNEAINAAPFYALLKPRYTYSRRKYTRYSYRKKDSDEKPKNPVSNINRDIVGTSQMLESRSKQIGNINGQSEIMRLKFSDNRIERDTRGNDSEGAQNINLEYGRQMAMLNQHRTIGKHKEVVCCNNTENNYGLLKNNYNEDEERKRNSQNKRYNLSVSNEELSKENEQVSLLKRIPQSRVLKNEKITKDEPENFNKNKSHQESSLLQYLDKHSVSVHEKPINCCKKRKYDTGNDTLNMPESSIYNVLRVIHDQKIDVPNSTQGTKHEQGFQIGKDLNKKGDVSGNEIIQAQLKATSVNSSHIGGFEILGNTQPNLNKKQPTSEETNANANSARNAHECRGKEVCSNCKKKKKDKSVLNSLNRTSLTIGSTVKVRVPVTERLKGYPNYIVATIVEEKDKMYKVATPKGVLKEKFKRDQLFPCNAPADSGVSKNIKATETGKVLKSKVKRPFR